MKKPTKTLRCPCGAEKKLFGRGYWREERDFWLIHWRHREKKPKGWT